MIRGDGGKGDVKFEPIEYLIVDTKQYHVDANSCNEQLFALMLESVVMLIVQMMNAHRPNDDV